MRDPSESRLNGRCSTLFSWLILAFLCVAVIAQKNAKSNPPKYDLHTETKIKATVEEVKLPPKGSEKEAVHLLVKTGTDTFEVYLPEVLPRRHGRELQQGGRNRSHRFKN